MLLPLVLLFFNFTSIVTSFKIANTPNKASGCQYNINQLPLNTPLVLNVTTRGILYPDYGSSLVTMKKGQMIQFDCPSPAKLFVRSLAIQKVTNATCVSGMNFAIEDEVVNIKNIQCSGRIKSVARYTGATCWCAGKEIEVGLEVRDGRWLQLYTSCFDSVKRNVLYSRYFLSKYIGSAVTSGSVPGWSEGNFYKLGITVKKLYPIAVHRVTINRQVGLKDEDRKYVKVKDQYFLAKGHLTARADFLYNAQQMQTFYYINSIPQWQTFNMRNWFYLERCLRNYASNNQVDLVVYTGTYGILTLPHAVTGKPVKLYLYVDDNGNKAMPIPELLWKVIYAPVNLAGIAVLGINNPYQTDVNKSIICKDIADKLTWLSFDRSKLKAGYIYACTIADLRKVIRNLPKFIVHKILN